MNQILNLIGNIICVSILEEFFISFLILYLIKIFRIQNHDFFDINNDFVKKFIRLILISVIPMAVISNLLIFWKVDEGLTGIIGIILTSISIMLYLKIDVHKWVKTVFIFLTTIVAFAVFMVIEQSTIQLVFYVTKTNREYFLQNFKLTFLLTMFERVIEYAFILFVFVHKNSLVKVNIIKTVIKSRWLLTIFIFYIFINCIALIMFCEGVFTGNFLNESNGIYKVIWTLCMFILVTVDICSSWLIAMLIQIKERYKYKYGKEAKI